MSEVLSLSSSSPPPTSRAKDGEAYEACRVAYDRMVKDGHSKHVQNDLRVCKTARDFASSKHFRPRFVKLLKSRPNLFTRDEWEEDRGGYVFCYRCERLGIECDPAGELSLWCKKCDMEKPTENCSRVQDYRAWFAEAVFGLKEEDFIAYRDWRDVEATEDDSDDDTYRPPSSAVEKSETVISRMRQKLREAEERADKAERDADVLRRTLGNKETEADQLRNDLSRGTEELAMVKVQLGREITRRKDLKRRNELLEQANRDARSQRIDEENKRLLGEVQSSNAKLSLTQDSLKDATKHRIELAKRLEAMEKDDR